MVKPYRLSKSFIVSFGILVFISLNYVVAEEINLRPSEQVEYKGITIELKSIGTEESVALKVNSISLSLSEMEQKVVYDLNITLLETKEDTAKILVIPNVECLIDEDCNQNLPCIQNICSIHKECISTKTEGCMKDGVCFSKGALAKIEQELVYCSSDFEWKKRKVFNLNCEFNYECLSNTCIDGLCTKVQKKKISNEKMAPLWILTLLGIILLIKGAFIFYYPEKTKHLLREISYKRLLTLRIMGSILAILGILLIIWALT